MFRMLYIMSLPQGTWFSYDVALFILSDIESWPRLTFSDLADRWTTTTHFWCRNILHFFVSFQNVFPKILLVRREQSFSPVQYLMNFFFEGTPVSFWLLRTSIVDPLHLHPTNFRACPLHPWMQAVECGFPWYLVHVSVKPSKYKMLKTAETSGRWCHQFFHIFLAAGTFAAAEIFWSQCIPGSQDILKVGHFEV